MFSFDDCEHEPEERIIGTYYAMKTEEGMEPSAFLDLLYAKGPGIAGGGWDNSKLLLRH